MRHLCLLLALVAAAALAQNYQPLLNHERMTELFMQMARIDSGSENEAAMTEFVARQLRELGAETVVIDEASKQLGGTGGNVFARFRGMIDAPPLLLNAHIDTVQPTAGIQLIRDANEIRTDGRTILGADDKAGVAIILEVLRTLKERNLPHPPLEVVFTIREEKGLQGAKVFDTRQLRARTGVVVDGGADPAVLYIQSPTHWRFEVVFHGKAAHSGAEPEKGRNAIVMAARAIAQMQWGRIDAETTANVGTIEGGQAMNIVPERAKLVGEFRSFDPQRARALAERWKAVCEQVAQEMEGSAEVSLSQTFEAVRLSPDAPIVRAAVAGLKTIGLEAKLERTGGGTDANAFAPKGIQCLVFPTGADRIHTTQERLLLRNFYLCGEGLLQTILHWGRQSQPQPAVSVPKATVQ
ncbi:MAG: M20/M25/M40 family metallo-hydrolase [Fimbriimonadales bacterium]|nr:M20/M25/M40 family metallo-hydrolase [Fimbriimonadales bacterium]